MASIFCNCPLLIHHPVCSTHSQYLHSFVSVSPPTKHIRKAFNDMAIISSRSYLQVNAVDLADNRGSDYVNGRSSFPVPDFVSLVTGVTLLEPHKQGLNTNDRHLSVYATGMDCTGRGIRKQLLPPYSAGGQNILLEDFIDSMEIKNANGFQTPNTMLAPLSEQDVAIPTRKKAVPNEVLNEMGYILAPWRFLTSPILSGEENLPNPTIEPRRPVLFVGNHTIFGGYDTPILLYELYLRGYHVRGLAHPSHWSTMIGSIFERYGHVKASNFTAYQLLKDGESILLFPGGVREVYKNKGESYKLMWKPTTDFVRMASRFKAIIVPFAALGGDDAFTVLTDSKEVLKSPIGPFVQDLCSWLNVSSEHIPPLTAFPGTTLPSPFPIPAIERIYFHFARPIDTTSYSENLKNRKEFATLYSLVKRRVEESINQLQQIRLNDPERTLPVRLTSNIMGLVSDFYRTWVCLE